jgi:hypothetical protein
VRRNPHKFYIIIEQLSLALNVFKILKIAKLLEITMVMEGNRKIKIEEYLSILQEPVCM